MLTVIETVAGELSANSSSLAVNVKESFPTKLELGVYVKKAPDNSPIEVISVLLSSNTPLVGREAI